MSGTATTHLAREHARAQAGTVAGTQRTIPAGAAKDLPAGIDAGRVVWDETLPAGGYCSRVLRRGTTVRLTDLKGDGCVQMLVFNAERTYERLNIADVVKVQWNAYPAKGALLLSDMGRALMSVVEDTRGRNDTFCGASTAWSNEKKYGAGAGNPDRPNARDRFTVALAKHGMTRRDIGPSITLFKGARIEANGRVTFLGEPGKAGDCVELKAEMNVLLVMANCPHVLDPRKEYVATPVRATAWRGEPTGRGDALWISTPEVERAFLNTEDYFLG